MLLMMAVLNFVGHKTIIDILRKMEVNASINARMVLL